MEFKNHSTTEPYRCFLYRQVDGKTDAKIFEGEEATQAGLDAGWVKSPSSFIDEAEGAKEMTETQVEQAKDATDMFARDADVLANADKIDDIELLRKAYAQLNGKPIKKTVTTLKGVRIACNRLLGELNGDSSEFH